MVFSFLGLQSGALLNGLHTTSSKLKWQVEIRSGIKNFSKADSCTSLDSTNYGDEYSSELSRLVNADDFCCFAQERGSSKSEEEEEEEEREEGVTSSDI